MKISLITGFVIGALAMSSCSLNEQNRTNAYAVKSVEKNLTSGPWLMNSVVSTHNTEIYDLYAGMDYREKDNSLIFFQNRKVVTDEGVEKYNYTDPQVIDKGLWKLNGDATKLIVEENGEASELEILSISDSELKLRAVEYDAMTDTQMSLTICYRH